MLSRQATTADSRLGDDLEATWAYLDSIYGDPRYVADDATRGISVKDLNGRWMNGPQFLYMPEEDWPEAIAVTDKAEVSKECRKVQAVFQLQNIAVMLQQAIDCKRFSKWRSLIRVTAWMIRFVDNLKAKVITGRAES